MNMSKCCKIRVIKAPVVAGTTAQTSDVIDMQGFAGVVIVSKFGTSNAGNYVNLQEDSDPAGGALADLAGTKKIQENAAALVIHDIYKPCKRYLAAKATRGASSTLDFMVAILYEAGHKPTNNDVTNVVQSLLVISPVAGTA